MAKEDKLKEQQRASSFEGFDIPIDKHNKGRIDRMVDDYESRIMSRIDGEYLRQTSWSERLADKIASFGGSWTFIVIFSAFLATWMIFNTLRFIKPFDRPPFILLNLILSFTAAFQAPIILMSQNRQSERDKHEAVIDFAINYKAEQEIDDVQKHLHRMEKQINEMKEILEKLQAQAGE